MPIPIIDTHCHLDIIESEGLPVELALQNAKAAGVSKLLQIGIDLESSRRAQSISKQNPVEGIEVNYSIGCHPTETHEFPKAEEILQFATEHLADPRFVAIGEIGIDLYHTADSRNYQRETFSKFLSFSEEHQLPVVIHSRDGFEDTFEVLKEHPKAFGVIHCFTYDSEKAKKFVELGYYISFSGILVFKNATAIQEAARDLPLESILVETDAPFLAPPPHRGKRNEPAYVQYVLEKLYSLRKEPNTKVQEQVLLNSEKFLQRKAYHHA